MRTNKGAAIFGQLLLVVNEMSREINNEESFVNNIEKYKTKLDAVLRKLNKYNKRLKDENFKPAFLHLEKAAMNFRQGLENVSDEEAKDAFNQALEHLKKYGELLPGGDQR